LGGGTFLKPEPQIRGRVQEEVRSEEHCSLGRRIRLAKPFTDTNPEGEVEESESNRTHKDSGAP